VGISAINAPTNTPALLAAVRAYMCRYQTDSLYPSKNFGLPRANAVQLLNLIDSNLRKEYVMEGVFQWSFSKLLPPLVASELVVSLPCFYSCVDPCVEI
jgi:hypothetical protein